MTAFVGRNVALTWNGTAILGVREKSPTLSGEPIDITSDEDNGWKALLEEVAVNMVSIALTGVTKSDALRRDWFAGTRQRAVVITYPDGGTISGTFMLASYKETGAYNNAVTFDAEIQSSGEVTYTPGS